MKRLLLFFLSVILTVSCFTGCKKDNEIDIVPEQPLSKPQETVEYKNYEKANYFYLISLQIPTKWYLEEAENGFVLIEKKTGTEIGFVIEDYSPTINNIKYDDAKNFLTSETKTFVSFQKTTGNQLFYKYYLKNNGMQYAVCETLIFNFKYSYTLKLICEERFYEEYYPVYSYIVNSLQLPTNIATIPKGYNGLYFSGPKFLVLYPNNWKLNATNDYCATSYSSTTITTTFGKSIVDFEKMDKNTYTAIMQKTVKNFIVTSFSHKKTAIVAEGYYTENSTRYVVLNTIYNLKDCSVNIVYVSPENEYQTYIKQYDKLSKDIYPQ